MKPKLSKGVILGHVSLEVTNLATARKFYDRFLSYLGFTSVPLQDRFWAGYRNSSLAIWITSSKPRRVTRRHPHVPTTGAQDPISDHLGFFVPSLNRLRELESKLIANGYKPVYRLDKVQTGYPFTSQPSWYISCSWADPDNNVLELYTTVRADKKSDI